MRIGSLFSGIGGLELPLGWKRLRAVFMSSMSDLFREEVPPETASGQQEKTR